MPNRSTFQIPPIKRFIERYVTTGRGWADPFSGWSTIAEYRNDLRTHDTDGTPLPAQSHMLAADWVDTLPDNLEGVLWDPPYSARQVSEHYTEAGRHAYMEDTNGTFYSSVRKKLAPKVKPGGHVLCFGWDGGGFGTNNGMELLEMMVVIHGGHHNATICTAEKKIGAVAESSLASEW